MAGLGSGVQLTGTVVSGELHRLHRLFRIIWACDYYFTWHQYVGPRSLDNDTNTFIARLLCEHTEQGWRWIYYIVAILSFLAAGLQLLCYFPPRFELLHKNTTKTYVVKHLDYVGLAIYTVGITALLLGISWGGQRYRMQAPAHIPKSRP